MVRLTTHDPRPTTQTAQATLEITLALISVLLLLLGSLKLFLWVNQRLVQRHQDYENSRVSAGTSFSETQVDETAYPELNIFGK